MLKLVWVNRILNIPFLKIEIGKNTNDFCCEIQVKILIDLFLQMYCYKDLLKGQNVEYQASHQVVVFINGAYWGIHNLREKYDKYILRIIMI